MFSLLSSKYYYARQGEDYLVYSIIASDEGLKLSLYKNEQLVDHRVGVICDFILKGEDLELTINNTALKSKHTLLNKGHRVELKSVSLRKLRGILKMARINNALNPAKVEGQSKRIFKKMLWIILLLSASFGIYYFIHDLKNTYELIPFVFEFIAGWMLFDLIAEKFVWLKEYEKAKLLLIIAIFIAMSTLADQVF